MPTGFAPSWCRAQYFTECRCSAQRAVHSTFAALNKRTTEKKENVRAKKNLNASGLLHLSSSINPLTCNVISSLYHARSHIPRSHQAKCSQPDTRTEEHPANSNAKPFPKIKNVKYSSASKAEVSTDPPALCPTTGPDISRTGVPADLEDGGGVGGVPYPNPTYKSIMKACHAPYYMSSDHPKNCSR